MNVPSRYVAILDVGHGNSCVVHDDGGTLAIDTGLGTSLLEFLKGQGISKLDVVLVSHADQDHISGLLQLLASKEFVIGRVRLNTDAAKSTKLWKNLVYELEDQDARGMLNWEVQLTAESGEKFLQGRLDVEILTPGKALAAIGPGGETNEGSRVTTNSISCVVRLLQDGEAIAILPGDLDEVGLADLRRRLSGAGDEVQAPILVFPHHGGLSGGGDAERFAVSICELFKPSTVLFSIGRGKHSTPRPEIVAAVRKCVPHVRIACTQLSEHCASSVSVAEPEHLLPVYAEGRDGGVCCAGTMLIDLDDTSEVIPNRQCHEGFVATLAPTALCLGPLE